jgi:Response regulator containing CheY-like receiver domain and AraC-type DNA-binding domain
MENRQRTGADTDTLIQLIIVDDESATRNGLLQHIDWKMLGVDMVQTAKNAQEALALCEHFRPDIILSDIRMRGMDGVKMCRILHERYPETQIIFISGFSDKAYLKAAISLRAVDYVEKPIHKQTLEATIKKAISYLSSSRAKRRKDAVVQDKGYLERELLLSLIYPKTRVDERIKENIKDTWIFRKETAGMRVGLLTTTEPVTNIDWFRTAVATAIAEQNTDIQTHLEFMDNHTLLIVLYCTKETQKKLNGTPKNWQRLVENGMEGNRLFLALGNTVAAPQELADSFISAQKAQKSLFCRGYGHVQTEPWVGKRIYVDPAVNTDFADALFSGSRDGAKDIILSIERLLLESNAAKSSYVHNVYFSLLNRIYAQYTRMAFQSKTSDSEEKEKAYSKIEEVATVHELTAFMQAQIDAFFTWTDEEENNNSAVSHVIRIIHQNFGDKSLSGKKIADEVYLTPTYLSALFKRKTGKTMSEYIVQVRIEQAKELLWDKSLKLYHVAEKVGYEDSNYFAKIFKKVTGVSPSEYKERI